MGVSGLSMIHYTLACLTNLSSLKIIFPLLIHHVMVIIILCNRDKMKLFIPFINTAFNSRWHTFQDIEEDNQGSERMQK